MLYVLDEPFFTRLSILRTFAESHPISIDHQLDVNNGEAPAVGDYSEYRVENNGLKIAFSHDLHPMGTIRHMSVSLAFPGKLPDPFIIDVLMGAMDFTHPIEECKVWLEDIAPNHKAVNVAELIPSTS